MLDPRNIKHKGLRRFAQTGDYSKIGKQRAERIGMILDDLNAAVTPQDMQMPGYRFHEYKGQRKGTFSVDVTGNWRITFRWEGDSPFDVNLEDPHG